MGDIIFSGAAVRKAGSGVSSSIPHLAWIEWISGAESAINDETRTDWSALFSGTAGTKKAMVSDTVASLVAMDAINYDMSGFVNILEATTKLDVLTDRVKRQIKLLTDKNVKSTLGVD